MTDLPAPIAKAPSPQKDWPAFIAANTRLLPPPLVPEIVLQLAEESLPIWQRTEDELGEMNVPPPFWAFAWAGGQALARYLLDTPHVASGRRVLDLGAGSGLAAIAALKAGAQSALAVDIDAIALEAIALNARANGVTIATSTRDVLDDASIEDGSGGRNLILVGDLFYARELATRVLVFADRAHSAGAVVLAGDPRRNYFPEARFEQVAEYRVPVTRELEDSEIKRTAVWRLLPR